MLLIHLKNSRNKETVLHKRILRPEGSKMIPAWKIREETGTYLPLQVRWNVSDLQFLGPEERRRRRRMLVALKHLKTEREMCQRWKWGLEGIKKHGGSGTRGQNVSWETNRSVWSDFLWHKLCANTPSISCEWINWTGPTSCEPARHRSHFSLQTMRVNAPEKQQIDGIFSTHTSSFCTIPSVWATGVNTHWKRSFF